MTYNMFTNVFDVFDMEMKSIFFKEMIQYHYMTHVSYAVSDRLIAYSAYGEAVKNRMRFEHTMVYAGFTLQYLRHDEKWDKYVKSDKLQQKAHSLLKVTPSVREFHEWRMSKETINYIY